MAAADLPASSTCERKLHRDAAAHKDGVLGAGLAVLSLGAANSRGEEEACDHHVRFREEEAATCGRVQLLTGRRGWCAASAAPGCTRVSAASHPFTSVRRATEAYSGSTRCALLPRRSRAARMRRHPGVPPPQCVAAGAPTSCSNSAVHPRDVQSQHRCVAAAAAIVTARCLRTVREPRVARFAVSAQGARPSCSCCQGAGVQKGWRRTLCFHHTFIRSLLRPDPSAPGS